MVAVSAYIDLVGSDNLIFLALKILIDLKHTGEIHGKFYFDIICTHIQCTATFFFKRGRQNFQSEVIKPEILDSFLMVKFKARNSRFFVKIAT